jgi:hypothetical protein
MDISTPTLSPLRQRMLEDMRMRKFKPKTQFAYLRAVRKLAISLRLHMWKTVADSRSKCDQVMRDGVAKNRAQPLEHARGGFACAACFDVLHQRADVAGLDAGDGQVAQLGKHVVLQRRCKCGASPRHSG